MDKEKTITTLGEMLERSRRAYPQATAIVYKEKKISYQHLDRLVNKLANGLLGLGLKRGDRVGLLSPKMPEVVISFLGVAKAGGIVVPLNFKLEVEKLRLLIRQAGISVLIVHSSFFNLVYELTPLIPNGVFILVGSESKSGFFSWDEVMAKGSDRRPPVGTKPDEVVYYNYTSGSTGLPKGAITTHANILWNTISTIEALEMTQDDVYMGMFAVFSHPHELFARSIFLGGTLVLLDSIFPKTISRVISRNRVSCVMGVPSMYEMLLSCVDSREFDLSSLRVPESGGGYVTTRLLTKFKEKVKVSLLPVWGSTETSGPALARPLKEEPRVGCIGKPCPSYQVKIVNESGQEVAPGEVGEMLITGPAVARGYVGLPEETRQFFQDGWYRTGDLVRREEDEHFYFLGRKNEMMKVGGIRVYPQEIEVVLAGHSKVSEVVVVAIRERLRGEVPKAIVVFRKGERCTPDEIKRYCQERLTSYKIPRSVEFWDELPRTPNGKVDRKVVVERANNI